MESYLEITKEVYKQAALSPNEGMCCTTSPAWQLPGLHIPKRMMEMNYGCGTTVHPRDLSGDPNVLYIGVGGGMELLQFAYFSRRRGAITGIDMVDEMLKACADNMLEAEQRNDWFSSDFIELRKGDALELPVDDESIDLALWFIFWNRCFIYYFTTFFKSLLTYIILTY